MVIANHNCSNIERLYQLYSDTVYRIGVLYMGNEQEAYDIVQDVFLKLLCHPRQFKDKEHEKAWILRVAINRCKDQLKSHWRKKRTSWNEYQEGIAFSAENSRGDHREEQQIIMDAVMKLPDIYKEVVLLHYYEGYKAEEIEGIKVEEAKKTFKKQKEIERGPIISHVSIEIENVIQMPSLTWKIKEDDIIEEVYVSVIAARAFDRSDSGSSKFEIVLKDGMEWHYNSRTGNIYRYDYIDIDSISGISLNGTFYPVSEAERVG